MKSNREDIKSDFLYGCYPYERIVESDRDEDWGISYIALIYRQCIVALGVRHWSTSLYQEIYASITDLTPKQMRRRLWALKTVPNPAAGNLYAKISRYKIAERDKLPEPNMVITYRVLGRWCGENVEYQIHQRRWCRSNETKYELIMTYVNVPGKTVSLATSDCLGEIADIISQRTKRKVTLI